VSVLDTRPRSSFPEDLWSELGFPDTRTAMAEMDREAERLERVHGAQRDFGLVKRFVDELPSGRILIHGAGTHSRVLLDLLRCRPGIRVEGVVDRMAGTVDSFEGLPVVSPVEAARASVDYILLSHTSAESEMAEALGRAGMESARVVPIYAHPAYRRLAWNARGKTLDGLSRRSIDTVIVTCAPNVIVADADLARVADPTRTLQLYFGRDGAAVPGDTFETISIGESLDLLRGALELLRPNAVIVRSILYKNFLGALVRRWMPNAVVIHELYDYAVCWPDADLASLFGLSPSTIRMLRLSEFCGGQDIDLRISKRAGPDWDKISRRCAAPYRLHYPLVREPPPETAGGPGADFVYAGFLPAPSFLRHYRSAYNFMPIMEAVCERGGLRGDVYNAAHFAGAGDTLYAEYLRDFGGDGPVRYHRRLPYDMLLAEMGRCGWGWLADRHDGFFIDRRVGICNRWTGYLSAGLPVVLDAGWTLMADLQRRFDAGIVADSLDPSDLAERVRTADRARLAAGAGRLRRHLLEHNADTLDLLADVIERRGRAKKERP